MRYIKNNLFIDNKGIFDLANKYGTPLYCYSYNKLKVILIDLKIHLKKYLL